MNTNALSIRRLAVVSSLVILGMTAWTVVPAAEASSIHVKLADLDLSTPAGRQVANDRLHGAARTVCDRVSDAEDLGRSRHVAACIDRVMAKQDALLQQLAARSGSIQVATTPIH